MVPEIWEEGKHETLDLGGIDILWHRAWRSDCFRVSFSDAARTLYRRLCVRRDDGCSSPPCRAAVVWKMGQPDVVEIKHGADGNIAGDAALLQSLGVRAFT